MVNKYTICSLMLALLALQGCSIPTMMPDAKSTPPTQGRVIVVGKFEFVPPLTKRQRAAQSAGLFTSDGLVNRVYVATAPYRVKGIDGTIHSSQWGNTITTTWGKTFFKVTAARKTYLNEGMFYTNSKTGDQAWLPGGMSFTPPPHAKAVYIGTVRYIHDPFLNVTKIEIIDQYRQAKAVFEKRFGRSVRLEKALLR